MERKTPKALLLMLLKPSSHLLYPGCLEGWMHLTEAPSNLLSGYPAPFYVEGRHKTLTLWIRNCDQHCLPSPSYLCFI